MSMTEEITAPASIHHSVGYWAGLLARSMESEFNRRLAAYGVTRMSYAVLGAMVFDGKSTPSSIADFLGVDRGATTRLIDKLEGRGLLARVQDLDDGRRISITVTPEGETLAKEMRKHSRAVNANFTAKLDSEEVETFIALVQTMLSSANVKPNTL